MQLQGLRQGAAWARFNRFRVWNPSPESQLPNIDRLQEWRLRTVWRGPILSLGACDHACTRCLCQSPVAIRRRRR